jgi:rhamnosyltransferase
VKISVVLLTKDGGALLRRVAASVVAQRLGEPFEVLAIDSGSADGTAQFLRAGPRITFIGLAPREFQHGRTRNLAMARARGELVAFLTQDAIPCDDGWLASWVRFMDAHPEVAGAFGSQAPRPGADPLEAWEVAHHFGAFARGPAVLRALPEGAPVPEKMQAHFFSNVNSCIRREAWVKVPFREIPFGEDQAWASDAQRAGLATGFCADAAVYHSHDYGPVDLFRRRYDESRFVRRHFGHSLIGTWAEAARTARAHAAFYREQVLQPASQGIGARVRAYARAWASALGNLAGARLAHHDGLAHRVLSLTERHMRGGGS